jgi:hypothetical protein
MTMSSHNNILLISDEPSSHLDLERQFRKQPFRPGSRPLSNLLTKSHTLFKVCLTLPLIYQPRYLVGRSRSGLCARAAQT